MCSEILAILMVCEGRNSVASARTFDGSGDATQSAINPAGGMLPPFVLRNGDFANPCGYHTECTARGCRGLSKSKLDPVVGNRNQSITRFDMLSGAAQAQSAIR